MVVFSRQQVAYIVITKVPHHPHSLRNLVVADVAAGAVDESAVGECVQRGT